jgi:hypothetical protein
MLILGSRQLAVEQMQGRVGVVKLAGSQQPFASASHVAWTRTCS